jgi:PAS domain S-box-containing protein
MPSDWLAVPVGADSLSRARQLRESWERLLAVRDLRSEPGPDLIGELRQPIVESWQRSLDTGLDPLDLLAPLEADPAEIGERWAEHPLGSLAHVLRARLGDLARESQSLVVVSDATGLLLHIDGPSSLKDKAAEMNFVEGARYSEAVAGTNGIGTVLAADHALQVFASEHFNQRHHGWSCSGAPVHDPVSGRLLGVVDISSAWQNDDPLSLELPVAAARALERCLADARRHSDARLRRRYSDFATKATDLLVSSDGYVLAGERMAAPAKPFAIPPDGGEIVLADGSIAAAVPLGHGEAYLVRPVGRSAAGAAPTKAAERTDEAAGEEVEPQRAGGIAGAYFEAALDCVIIADASGRVVEFNPAAERTFGYSRDQAIGRTMAELIVPPSLRQRHSDGFARFIETGHGTMLGRRRELTGMRADGSEFPVELALSRADSEPLLICGTLRDVSAAKEAERHLRELAEEQAALRRVAMLVARESSPQRLFALVAEQVARIIDVPLVRLARYESDGSTAELIGVWGESVDPLALGTRWQLDGPGVLAAVWRSGLPARLDDYTDLPGEAAAVVRLAGMRSAVASPIVVDGRLWGAIAVLSPRREPLSENTEARLADFTELVATAMANADSHAEIARLADEQAALRRVATLVARGVRPDDIFSAVSQEVQRLFGLREETMDVATVVRFDPGPEFALVGAAKGIEGLPLGTRWPPNDLYVSTRVHSTGRFARVDEADLVSADGHDAATLRRQGIIWQVASPIVVEGRLWGAITLNAGAELPPDTEGRLERFTELVATAIANSEARDHLRRVVDEQAALRRVATLIAEGAAPATLFSAVTEEVAGLFEDAAVTLDRYDGGVSTVLAATGIGFPVGSRWPLDVDSLAARVYATGRPVHVADYEDIAAAIPREMWEGHLSKSDFGVPIIVDGSLWGVLCVGTPELDRNPSETTERIGRFTELVATAVSNATMRGEVAASRARVIAAGDETRRRIERDLHDGAQQQLVTLALELRSAEDRLPAGLDDLKTEVGRFADRLTTVIEELREMSRGIHPAILTEGGLAPAIEALALRSPVPVKLALRSEQRLAEGVEVAAYYVVSEALTNAAKHADASRVHVALDVEEETLYLSIADDGVGGARLGGGSGLIGLKDRVEAFGGTIDLVSPPGSGTRIDVKIPLLGDPLVASGAELLSRA